MNINSEIAKVLKDLTFFCSVIGCRNKATGKRNETRYCQAHSKSAAKGWVIEDVPLQPRERYIMATQFMFDLLRQIDNQECTEKEAKDILFTSIKKLLTKIVSEEKVVEEFNYTELEWFEGKDLLKNHPITKDIDIWDSERRRAKLVEKLLRASRLSGQVTGFEDLGELLTLDFTVNVGHQENGKKGYKHTSGMFIEKDDLIRLVKKYYKKGKELRIILPGTSTLNHG